MRKVFSTLLILLSFNPGFAQELPAAYRAYNERFPEGPSCGQAALVGYNFTYEIDYLRDQPAVFLKPNIPRISHGISRMAAMAGTGSAISTASKF